MITITHEPGYVSVAVFNEFTVHDFRQFEDDVRYKINFEGKPNLLFDFTGMMRYTLDMAVEEYKFARAHSKDFGKVAVVTDDQWITWSAWLNQLFSDAKIEIFDSLDEAKGWLLADGTQGAAA
ncbi:MULTISPECIES: STAS/SEC14 domain-containing protein [Silvimonas]|uniref:STAS/SEC14 domain-containing protein n=1 Tax=Silvimonas TaxID=300264 RepID=UPI0024B31F9E|nr:MULTISPECIES: STAS/SEC14 domain-containing protein [Silvimonas]MDR3428338.1 STAS/SEC14 domain-containing protein [Silvimonas sp.]